jgi:carbonic anhydrase
MSFWLRWRRGKRADILRSVPKSVRDDVEYLRMHPFIRKETKVTGLVYDTEHGRVECIEA